MTTTTSSTAQYKGRSYRLLWIGATKYGRRAHLQFLDGSKDFWVGADLIGAMTAAEGPRNGWAAASYRRSSGRRDGRCRECGGEVQSYSDGASRGLCFDCV